MYLSRLILNPRSRQVRSELADPYELHRTICRAFPNGVFQIARQKDGATGILFRLDLYPRTGIPTLLVQSRQEPDWSFLLQPEKNYLLGEAGLPLDIENPAVKPVNLVLKAGQVLAFRLRANPTKRLKDSAKRIGLYREEDQLAWLKRKIEAAGGALVSANIANEARVSGKLFHENEKHNLRFVSVQFDGILQVKSPDTFVNTVWTGIGSGKGLGFGLLSLAPVRG